MEERRTVETNFTQDELEELAKNNYSQFLQLADYWSQTDPNYYTLYILPLLNKYSASQSYSQSFSQGFRQSVPQGTAPAKRKNATLIVVFAALGVAAIAFIAAMVLFMQRSADSTSTPPNSTSPTPTTSSDSKTEFRVKYEVTGTASSVSITIYNESGKTEQFNKVNLPWEKVIYVKPGGSIYLSAQNKGDIGSVTARIFVDGEVFKESTTTGAYGVASVSGTAK